jgi:glycosyltransferase involved in cell wall biosynthesis
MPCYNEERFIARAIESLTDEYVQKHAEILVVDGMSTDKTLEIAAGYAEKNVPVRILKNEKRLQCHGLNLGISQAKGDIIVRVDAHSAYPEGYVKKLVQLLESTDAANVGGVMLPIGHTPVQQAIAFAMRHPIGVGDARFHLGNYKGYVDTVYLGAFRKEIFDKVGLYDTNCRTNEDAELNIRILKQGGKIYLDGSIEVEYLPRDSFAKLAVQYFRYGKGRAYTTVKHRRMTSFRQLAPPLLVLGLTASLVLSFFQPLFLVFWGCYILPVLAAALFTRRKIRLGLMRRFLAGMAFMIMHITWGAGFLSFFLQPATPRRGEPIRKPRNRKTDYEEKIN